MSIAGARAHRSWGNAKRSTDYGAGAIFVRPRAVVERMRPSPTPRELIGPHARLGLSHPAGSSISERLPFAAPMALEQIPQALWFFLPAYVANPMAVVFGGGTPIDFGRALRDGERLFGDGKTWRGLVGGTGAGAVAGLFLSLVANLVAPGWSFGDPATALLASAALAIGALLGDLWGAFVKRRLHRPRGAKTTGLDQYDFVIGALAATALFPGWSSERFFLGDALLGLLAIILITPALHRAVNVLGYRLGRKHEPW